MIGRLVFEHDLFGKPVPTFPDHAPEAPFDRHEPVRLMNGAEKRQRQNDLKGVLRT
jgi:hypothetical protein